MRKYLIAVAIFAALAGSANAQVNSQQQRMTDCNAPGEGDDWRCPEEFYELLFERSRRD